MDFANIEQLYASASSSSSSSSEEALEAASKLVRAEMALLLAHDATMHPFLKVGRAGGKMDKKKQKQESKKRGRDGASLQSRMDGKLLEVTDEEMAAARSLVAAELAADAEDRAHVEDEVHHAIMQPVARDDSPPLSVLEDAGAFLCAEEAARGVGPATAGVSRSTRGR